MATTEKTVKKAPVKKSGAKRTPARRAVAVKPAAKSAPVKNNTSVKYTNMFAAYRAFWRRGFTEWGGTSSRSEYWLSWLTNLLIYAGFVILFIGAAVLDATLFTEASIFVLIVGVCLALYVAATLIPETSMLTRRMHDAGLSAWFWLLFLANFIPVIGEYIWAVAVLVFLLLPTKTVDNPYHKYNK